MAHTASCANANGHDCQCGGCGGALHGWQGWLELVDPPIEEAVESKRDAVRKKWVEPKDGSKPKPSIGRRLIVLDLARFDIAKWLRRNKDLKPGSGLPTVEQTERSGKEGGRRQPTNVEGTNVAPTPADQVEKLGRLVAVPTWAFVEDVADGLDDPPAQKKKLARHVWCDLFIGLARAVEEAQGALDDAKELLKSTVRSSILGSEPQRKLRKGLSAKLIDALVDKGWDHLIAAVTTQSPGLGAITKPDLLRSLRIMAVFCCPAPERHAEVREHALKPLEEDAKDLLTDEVKDRLKEVVPEWA